ncbi:ABC-F family ATP-binding cassette domain-containing protein [Cytophagaceae bacterium ABcell3]|nr:ABC-F family ATP-binding cassette domain-containing protein [Cytophagaceae bacterium ABcell3]
MLSISDLSFYFGSRPLYENVSLHIKPKDKIGLIGANGTGKSTLLKLITGDYTPDSGEITKSNDCSIGFLNQDLLSYQTDDSILLVAMQAFERELELQSKIDKVLLEMEKDYKDELVEKLAKYQEEFEALDGYTIQSKAEEILEGLGFSTNDLKKPLRTFSGGWRMRVMLAKLLLMKPSILMLDEPTNHLDLPSIQWVEQYLEKYEGAVIVVSHDRQFLDNTVKTIVEVTQQSLNVYAGNYSFYLEEKALRSEIQKNAYENQQSKIKQTERFIERFKAKASKARQVQSRVKALEKMDMIEDVIDENAKVHFRFNFNTQPGKILYEFKDLGKKYGENVILKDTNISIERGDKIALVGANGKGKSTMLRIIAGDEDIQGKRSEGYNVITSFFAQHQLEALDLESTILDELKTMGTAKSETELRSILGCFLFSGDDVFKKIKILSGGEKSRVALAKTLVSEANFLLLDEPTNHLDIQSVNILIQALEQYEGSYVVISHDRHFISQVANKIWFIEDQVLKEYPGSFNEFSTWMQKREAERKALPESEPQVVQEKSKPKPSTASSNGKDKELKSVQNDLSKCEALIAELEQKKADIEEKLADPKVFGNPDILAEHTQKYEQLKKELDNENHKWEQLAEQIDSLEA